MKIAHIKDTETRTYMVGIMCFEHNINTMLLHVTWLRTPYIIIFFVFFCFFVFLLLLLLLSLDVSFLTLHLALWKQFKNIIMSETDVCYPSNK